MAVDPSAMPPGGDPTADPSATGSSTIPQPDGLNDRQSQIASDLLDIVDQFGEFQPDTWADGAHFMDAKSNPFKGDGIMCQNCAFYMGSPECAIVDVDIEDKSLCKFWTIPENKLKGKGKTRGGRGGSATAGAAVDTSASY